MKELCPAEALHEECGVFGIYDSTGKTNMVSAVYSALYALPEKFIWRFTLCSTAARKAAALP